MPPTPTPSSTTRSRPVWKELPVLVLVALGLALLVKTFLVQAFYIPSASMENTLQGGVVDSDNVSVAAPGHPFDRILVNKVVYRFHQPRRGDIVVFSRPPGWPPAVSSAASGNPFARLVHSVGRTVGLAPSGGDDFVKRVIGVAGDTVSCRHDVLTVNGRRLVEAYLYPRSRECDSIGGFGGRTVHVPSGELFVMGDHRDDSADSRLHGGVPVSDVVGRASLVIWPVSDWRHLT